MKNHTEETSAPAKTIPDLQRPLLIGEVLFDCFPNGHSVIGGAPFNVAWNLAGFGCDPLFLSAVGDDSLGQQAVSLMKDWQMDARNVAILPGLPTGRVDVINAETEPEYLFQDDCAWDHLRLEAAEFSPDRCALLYHGSLAARAETSRTAILKLREDPALPVFVDLNLRPPFFERNALPSLARNAHWLKINALELELLADVLGVSGDDLPRRARAVGAALEVAHLLVTDGKNGAYWVEQHGASVFQAAPAVDHFVDSVGAGDAFASVSIYGILRKWDPPLILKRAVTFAAHVCEIQGATTKNRQFYDDELKQWK